MAAPPSHAAMLSNPVAPQSPEAQTTAEPQMQAQTQNQESPPAAPEPQILGPATNTPGAMEDGPSNVARTTGPATENGPDLNQSLPATAASNDEPVMNTAAPPAAPGSEQTMGDSALPDAGEIQARSPGLSLPVETGLVIPGGPPDGTTTVQKTKEEIEAEVREAAFTAALTGLLPLEPPEIRKVLQRYDQTQEAVETPVYPYPEPEIVVKTLSLDPGTKPLEIKVATGHVTTLNLVDSTGAPWPIQDVTWAGNFEIVQPEAGGHVIRITPLSEFAYGNMSMRLLELKTPITFTMRTHRDGVHYRVDARLPLYGPYATPPIIAGSSGPTLAAGDADMTSILDGIPPEKAKRMNVSGVDGRTTAYQMGEVVYVRTPLALLSPAWNSSVKSADGMNVYTMENSPVLLLSDQGRMVRARISERTVEQ